MIEIKNVANQFLKGEFWKLAPNSTAEKWWCNVLFMFWTEQQHERNIVKSSNLQTKKLWLKIGWKAMKSMISKYGVWYMKEK